MIRRFVVACSCVAVVLVAAGAGAEEAAVVVLQGGQEIPVASVKVTGSFVYLTLPNGQMQAYPVEDVDLELSGLLPEPVQTTETQPTSQPTGIAAAQSSGGDEASLVITDADVDHVMPASAEGSSEENAGSGLPNPLEVKDIRKRTYGGMLRLSGTVVNTGADPVSDITLVAQAMDKQGEEIGTKSEPVAALPPGATANFNMRFPVKGAVADIKVEAHGVATGPPGPRTPQRQQAPQRPRERPRRKAPNENPMGGG